MVERAKKVGGVEEGIPRPAGGPVSGGQEEGISAPPEGNTPQPIGFFDVCVNIPESTSESVSGEHIIESQSALETLWAQLFPSNPPPVPTVDFGKYTILGTFSGLSHTSTGHRKIHRIMDEPDIDKTMVYILRFYMGENCITVDYQCQIYHIVALPKPHRPIQFSYLMPGIVNCP